MFKRTIILLGISATCWGAPVVTPSTPVVTLGGTIQFASTDTVTWSLAAGSTGSISGTGLYTAPLIKFSAKNQAIGCPLRPNDDIVNTRIDNLPVHSSSTAKINNLLTVIGSVPKLTFQMSFPFNTYSLQTASQTFAFRYTHGSEGVYPIIPFPYRGEENSIIPNDYFFADHHLTGITSDTCHAYEMYQYYPVGADSVAPLSTSQSGYHYYGMSYQLPDTTTGAGGTDAAGMAIMPISGRYSELRVGAINHALRMTLDNGNLYSGFIWPATSSTNECSDAVKCFPYGSRVRLKSAHSCSSLSTGGQAICTTLKNYGAFMVDGGTAWAISMAYDAGSDTTTFSAMLNDFNLGASSVAATEFEMVDESSLMVSTTSGRVNLSNPYVTPSNYAEVIATKNSDSSTATVRVALQPVTVGFNNPAFQANGQGINVMAGTPAFRIPYWVNGATDTTATCSMSPSSLGTMTTGCNYTAPLNFFNQLASATVTISPTIAPNQAITFPLVVFSSDGIRMRQGPATSSFDTVPPFLANGDYVDASTRTWFMDPIGNLPNFYQRSTQGSSAWPLPDRQLYNSYSYGSGDKAWSAMVPNGTYQLKLNFGTNDPVSVAASTNSIDTQGVIFASSVSLVSTVFVPKIITTTVTVTSNQFYWALRGNESSSHNFISFWSLLPIAPIPMPFTGTPYMSINGKVAISGKVRVFK